MCENSGFKKIRTIPINLIQLHYSDDVINQFNLIDLEIRKMNCVSCFKKEKTTKVCLAFLFWEDQEQIRWITSNLNNLQYFGLKNN